MRATEPRRTAGAQQQEMKQTRHHQRRSRLPAQAFQNLRQKLFRVLLGLDTHVCLSDAVASTTAGSNPNLKLPRTPSLHSKRPSVLLCARVFCTRLDAFFEEFGKRQRKMPWEMPPPNYGAKGSKGSGKGKNKGT